MNGVAPRNHGIRLANEELAKGNPPSIVASEAGPRRFAARRDTSYLLSPPPYDPPVGGRALFLSGTAIAEVLFLFRGP
jgi:hypothetical protein